MDDNEKVTFQETVKTFITNTMDTVEGVDIVIGTVVITSQLYTQGGTNGLKSSGPDIVTRSLDESGLLVTMLVTGEVSYYGTLPENFSFTGAIIPGLENDFATLLTNLEDAFNVSNPLGNGPGSNQNTAEPTQKRNNFIVYLSVGCGVGAMIFATIVLLVYNRREGARRLQQLQDDYHDGQISAPFQDQNQFVEIQSELGSPDHEENGAQWTWVDPAETAVKKDLENPYSNINNLYSAYTSASHSDCLSEVVSRSAPSSKCKCIFI